MSEVRFGIYVYVDGYDLEKVAAPIKQRLGEMAARHSQLRVIDARFERTPDMHPDDLPAWNLGLNFDLDRESVQFVPNLLENLRSLAKETGREFAVGYYDRESQIDEDIGFIQARKETADIAGILVSLAE